MNRIEKAADTFCYEVSTDSQEGFITGALYVLDVVEGQLEGYKKNGSEETITALSNILAYFREKIK